MSDVSSSTNETKRYVWVFCLTLAVLALIDLALGVVSQPPVDPRVEPTKLQRYFNYGRSIEGKLANMLKPDDAQSAPIVVAGWIDDICRRTVAPPSGATPQISIFGNSFSGQLAVALSRFTLVEQYLGPGAPPNHSYACFVSQKSFGGDRNPIQVLGITTSSLSRMPSIWGVTTSYEYPQPFTFPRYRVGENGELTSHEPSVRSTNDLRSLRSNDALWKEWLAELQAEDYFYARRLVDSDLADKSVLGRMIRRGFGQSFFRGRVADLQSASGKIVSKQILEVLPMLIRNFAKKAREAGQRPVVVLFEEYGQGGVLLPMVGKVLADDGIDFLSSAAVVSPNVIGNYVPDGHFTPDSNIKMAKELMSIISSPTKNFDQIKHSE